jgi:hypothetical protein
MVLNPLNAELNPICHLLALLGAHHIFHVGGLRVKVKRADAEVHHQAPKTKTEHFLLVYGRIFVLKIYIIFTILLDHRMHPFT